MHLLVNVIDDLDGGLAGGGVQVGQRLVKKQDVHVIDHHASQGGALLLPAGKFIRGRGLPLVHIHHLRHAGHALVHLSVGNAIVFHGEGDILPHGEPHELPVGILQHGADDLGKPENIQVAGFLPLDLQAAFSIALVVKRDQSVQAVPQGALAAAAGTNDEDLLAGIDLQVNIMQRRFSLGIILEREMVKFDDGCLLCTTVLSGVRPYLVSRFFS